MIISGQEESPPSSIEGNDSDDSPESTVDPNLVSEFYPSPDYHYSFSYNAEFSKICLLGRMFNLSRKHGINTLTTIKKDIETVMIHEYSKNRDPVATQFVDTCPAVAAQVKQGFCSSLKSFFTKWVEENPQLYKKSILLEQLLFRAPANSSFCL